MRNMFKYLTTLRERLLVKLQATHNVFDYKQVKDNGEFLVQKGFDNSSDFDSDHPQQIVKEIIDNKVWDLSAKELNLL